METGSDIDDRKAGTSHTYRTPCYVSGTYLNLASKLGSQKPKENLQNFDSVLS